MNKLRKRCYLHGHHCTMFRLYLNLSEKGRDFSTFFSLKRAISKHFYMSNDITTYIILFSFRKSVLISPGASPLVGVVSVSIRIEEYGTPTGGVASTCSLQS